MKESVLSHRNEVTASSPSTVWMWLDESLLAIHRAPHWLEKMLTFRTKSMELVQGRRQSVYKQTPEWERTTLHGLPVLVTLQGFWSRIVLELHQRNIPFRLEDVRIPDNIPAPRLDLMKGFRFSQEEATTRLVSSGYSGRLSLPTRYGKSFCIINIMRAYPTLRTVLLAPGSDLLKQLTDELKRALEPEGREVKQMGGGSSVKFQSHDITVCSVDSAHKIDHDDTRLVIGDEIHALASETRRDVLTRFDLARKYGMTATMTGRYDKKDYLLEGLFGPVYSAISYPRAVTEGAVCQLHVMMLEWPIKIPGRIDRDEAMEAVYQSDRMGRCAKWLATELVPKEWQTLFFIKTEDQADFFLDYIGSETAVAMAKKLTKKQRDALTERVRANHISRVICSDIYVQGVTFHDLMCLVNLGGGGNSTTTIQKPGRLAEIRPGKSGALVVDFWFTTDSAGEQSPGVMQMVRESRQRHDAYKEIGYHVSVVHPAQAAEWLKQQNIQWKT